MDQRLCRYLHNNADSLNKQDELSLMQELFKSIRFGKCGEMIFETYLKMSEIKFTKHPKHIIDNRIYIVDFETETDLYEIKTRSYNCPGTAGDKIAYTPQKYKKLAKSLKKKLNIVLIGFQEIEFSRMEFDDEFFESIASWAKYVKMSEIIDEIKNNNAEKIDNSNSSETLEKLEKDEKVDNSDRLEKEDNSRNFDNHGK
jgi:hypothetical protein